MKSIFLTVITLIFLTSMNAYAADAIERKVANKGKLSSKQYSTEQIIKTAKLTCGYSTFKFKTKSKDPKALIEIYARKQGHDVKDPDDFRYEANVKSLPGADEDVSLFGTTDARGFESLFATGYEEDDEGYKRVDPMVKKLKSNDKTKAGGKRYIWAFGGGTGGSVCGVTWPGPILIDLESKTLFDFSTICGEC